MPLIDKIILGTVQFGLKYGINNTEGKPDTNQVYSILDYAHKAGVTTLDTATAYGDAIDIIGKYHSERDWKFNIISKFKVSGPRFDLSEEINASLEKLNMDSFSAYFFHSYADYKKDENLIEILELFREKGKIKRIGISIYTNDEFEQVLQNDAVDVIQLPFNLLDNFEVRGALLKKAKQKGVTIHTRSVFLQGLFFKDLNLFPDQLQPLKVYLQKIDSAIKEHNLSKSSLALQYVLQNPYVDGVLIGVDTLKQLKENIEMVNCKIPSTVIELVDQIRVSEVELLNPVNWK